MDKIENDKLVNDIAANISEHRKLETKELEYSKKNLAIALSNVYYFNKQMKIWITSSENVTGHTKIRDINGSAVGAINNGPKTTVTGNGLVVYRNSKVGELLIRNTKGTFNIPTPKGQSEIEIFNFSQYIPNPHNSEATDLSININEVNPRTYRSLKKLLEKLNQKDLDFLNLKEKQRKLDKENSESEELERLIKLEEKEKLDELEDEKRQIQENKNKEKADLKELERLIELEKQENKIKQEQERRALKKKQDDEAVEEVLNEIEQTKLSKQQALDEVQSFVRKSLELRYQPILDPFQEEIKRCNIFNATIAINGGPGTGKTTALIQRIKFLIDKVAMLGSTNDFGNFANEGYMPNMTKLQQDKLFGNKTNWVFFTPNELLKLFLTNNMVSEGLEATDKRVLIWNDYLLVLIKRYKIINTETKNPFLVLRKFENKNLLPHKGKQLKQILTDFENYFIKTLNEKLEAISQIETINFKWKNKGESIKNYINRQEKEYTIVGLFKLYFNLQEVFSDEVKQLSSDYNIIIKKSAAKILNDIYDNEEILNDTIVFAEQWIKESSNGEDENNDDDDDDDDDLEESDSDIKAYLFGKIKIILKNKALMKFDKKVNLSKKYREFNNVIKPSISIENVDDFENIGQLAYFNKYFASTVRGVNTNIISEIPKIYKAFRKNELIERKNKWDYKILEHIINKEKEKNKRIHPNEQSLLLYFINQIIQSSYKASRSKAKKINHPYFDAFNEFSVPVIGVDEATDFHIIDLLAIHSLSDIDISSVTYSGDIMQRLTDVGIRGWNELKPFIKTFEEKQLKRSYRQSPTLLEVATSIYNKATGSNAEYVSVMEKDKKEPKPLLFQSDDEYDKIEWISERILEIYKSYGKSIPSIAIFLPDENNIEEFTKELGDMDELADIGIKVKASNKGQVLGDTNTVRVFSIKYIKGMEFEAAFFHNIHKINDNSATEEMVLKNLYVGLSRASFYMAVTSSLGQKGTKFLEDIFETKQLTW
tara:strand:+ start:134 stop:3124 length:2991 start_codon:yes stop_codon:yes gene_type:complete